MSVVYRGQRLQLRRPVAIKFLHSSLAKNEEFLKRFDIETQTMSQLSHPNCISVTDFGVTDAPYIVMELVRGQTLSALVGMSPIEPRRAIGIIRQLLAGLAHAHKRGIIHRDIKPANIMLTEVTYTGDHVCVFDFGLAKLAEAGQISTNDADMVAGTIDYMSPEHIGGRELDWRADLFSSGVVLYQLLTGSKPFKAISAEKILSMHETKPLSLNDAHMAGGFSRELEEVVSEALATNPNERFQSAVDFASALDLVPESNGPAISTTTVPAGKDVGATKRDSSSWMPPVYNGRGGRRSLWIAGAVLGLVAIGVVVWVGFGSKMGDQLPETTGVDPVVFVESAAEIVSKDRKPEKRIEEVSPEPESEEESKPNSDPAPESEQQSERSSGSAKPPGLAGVIALVRAGKSDAAIRRLTRMQQEYPNSAYVYFLLGNLCSEKRQWPKAVAYYRDAVRHDDTYRSHRILINNTVRALGDNNAYEQAREVIEVDIGARALPELKRLAKQNYSKRFKRRVKDLLEQLTEQAVVLKR